MWSDKYYNVEVFVCRSLLPSARVWGRVVYSASHIHIHRVTIGSSYFTNTFAMSIHTFNPKSLLAHNHFHPEIGFSPKSLSTPNHFHPKIEFSPEKLSPPRSCTVPKISIIDCPPPHPPSLDLVDRVVISIADTASERHLGNHHGNIVFLLLHISSFWYLLHYVGVFSHLVKDIFYVFVEMPIKSTRQQTIVYRRILWPNPCFFVTHIIHWFLIKGLTWTFARPLKV